MSYITFTIARSSNERTLFMIYTFCLFSRIGYPCPINYNPADYFVQILAFIPEKEEESRERVKVCS